MNVEVSEKSVQANGQEVDLAKVLAGKLNQEGAESTDSAPVKTERPN